jgi:hypothetical protein
MEKYISGITDGTGYTYVTLIPSYVGQHIVKVDLSNTVFLDNTGVLLVDITVNSVDSDNSIIESLDFAKDNTTVISFLQPSYTYIIQLISEFAICIGTLNITTLNYNAPVITSNENTDCTILFNLNPHDDEDPYSSSDERYISVQKPGDPKVYLRAPEDGYIYKGDLMLYTSKSQTLDDSYSVDIPIRYNNESYKVTDKFAVFLNMKYLIKDNETHFGIGIGQMKVNNGGLYTQSMIEIVDDGSIWGDNNTEAAIAYVETPNTSTFGMIVDPIKHLVWFLDGNNNWSNSKNTQKGGTYLTGDPTDDTTGISFKSDDNNTNNKFSLGIYPIQKEITLIDPTEYVRYLGVKPIKETIEQNLCECTSLDVSGFIKYSNESTQLAIQTALGINDLSNPRTFTFTPSPRNSIPLPVANVPSQPINLPFTITPPSGS